MTRRLLLAKSINLLVLLGVFALILHGMTQAFFVSTTTAKATHLTLGVLSSSYYVIGGTTFGAMVAYICLLLCVLSMCALCIFSGRLASAFMSDRARIHASMRGMMLAAVVTALVHPVSWIVLFAAANYQNASAGYSIDWLGLILISALAGLAGLGTLLASENHELRVENGGFV